ncbi:hypothetical protein LguiA_023478 [Lonicera macranthoides]
MEWNRALLFLSFFLLIGVSTASTLISDGIFGSDASSIGRNLLQTKKACTINFEFQNYTIITSQCRGPQYPAQSCCAAFKQFACPFADELNDLTNDCASTMFSYINLHGRYPPGLFASECREGQNGLECPVSPPTPSADSNSSEGWPRFNSPPLLTLTLASFVLLLRLF